MLVLTLCLDLIFYFNMVNTLVSFILVQIHCNWLYAEFKNNARCLFAYHCRVLQVRHMHNCARAKHAKSFNLVPVIFYMFGRPVH